MKIDKEELNTLLNNINGNMRTYNEDITVSMKISDDLEMKRLKHETDQFHEDISEYRQEFSQSQLLDLIKEGSEISTEEGLEDVIPINWSNDVLAGKYRDQSIVNTSTESDGRKKSLVKK